MSWSVQNPASYAADSYSAVLTHSNGVSFVIKYGGAGFDSPADVQAAFEDIVDLANSNGLSVPAASRQEVTGETYTP